MKEKRILTIQDISCVGECSITVALPTLSAMGLETAILPTAVLSNHTTGFKGYSYLDLTPEMDDIIEGWHKNDVKFDGIYTGYIGSSKQIDYIIKIIDECMTDNGLVIVDPVMGDNGSLYGGFNDEYVKSVKKLVKRADVIVPNITEACFLTGSEYQTKQSTEYIEGLIAKLTDICPSKVVLTGVSFSEDTIGVACLDKDIKYAFSERIPKSYHGTGDVFASALAGCLFGGEGLDKATRLAIRFVLDSIRSTENEHWYGVRFEKAIPNLIENLKK